MTETVECAVIGAGAIGLAAARALALRGREVVVLEAADTIGSGTSSRNSEVIHAGIYYPRDSLKARLCVAGRRMLYRYCETHGIAHTRCGKLIVATDDAQLPALADVRRRAEDNGVDDLVLLDRDRTLELEPALWAVGALFSPSTGTVDSHGLMLAYLGDAEAAAAAVAFLSPVLGGSAEDGTIRLRVGGIEPIELRCRSVVNAAGLAAQDMAAAIAGVAPESIPRRYLAKGTYFILAGRSPFSRLIYPVPEKSGLGVHATVDLAGEARFGPDVEWVERIDYDVDAGRAERFYRAIRTYWPGLADGALRPGYAGIRPKLQAPGEPAADFVIQGPEAHGVNGLINLYGIESPGLTASLAIAELVADRLEERPAAAMAFGS